MHVNAYVCIRGERMKDREGEKDMMEKRGSLGCLII
jgi:hypothetical protein